MRIFSGTIGGDVRELQNLSIGAYIFIDDFNVIAGTQLNCKILFYFFFASV
jgi:hypothetical protein